MADQISLEFGEFGDRALSFLETAYLLLDENVKLPTKAEQIAYCVREALHSLIDSQVVAGDGWGKYSRRVVRAHDVFKQSRVSGLAADDAEADLAREVDAMAQFHDQQDLNARRLVAVLAERTGTPPTKEGQEAVSSFSSLLRKMSGNLHSSLTIGDARAGLSEAIRLIERLFMPRDLRNPRLEALAKLKSPNESSLAELNDLAIHPGYLRKFFALLDGPQWLPLLESSGVLDPPNVQGWWVGHTLVGSLKDDHSTILVQTLERLFTKMKGNDFGVYSVAWAAVELGEVGHALLLRCLRALPVQTAFIAIKEASEVDASSEFVDEVAAVVLRPAVTRRETYPDPILKALVAGLTEGNLERRIRMVVRNIRELPTDPNPWFHFEYEHGVSVASQSEYRRSDPANQLVHLLTKLLAQSDRFASISDLLALVEDLPTVIAGRIKPWLLATHTDVHPELLVQELTSGMLSKSPTVDDLALVDRAVQVAGDDAVAQAVATEIGPAPDAATVRDTIAGDAVPREWVKLYRWSAVLPEEGTAAWAEVLAVLQERYGPASRKAIEDRALGEFTPVSSSPSVRDLKKLPRDQLLEAIRDWRPSPADWRSSASDLASSLTKILTDDPEPWLEDPVANARVLTHPTYIRAYIDFLTAQVGSESVEVPGVVDLVLMVFTEPWPAETLGDLDHHDYDATWEWSRSSALGLIDLLAHADAHFGARTDDLVSALIDLAFASTDGYKPEIEETFTRALNHEPSVAFNTLFNISLNDHRANGSIRPAILDAFTRALSVGGPTGEELRSVLAVHLPQLHTCAPEWLDAHLGDLFGGPLGDTALGCALQWGSFSRVLMERYRARVWKAAENKHEGALEKIMLALMHGFVGYEPKSVVDWLSKRRMLSEAGESAARILSNSTDVEEPVIARVLNFWELANKSKEKESLKGFGWFAHAEQIPHDSYVTHLLGTLKLMHEGLDFSYTIAERLGKIGPTSSVLTCWDYLVRLPSEAFDQQAVIAGAVLALDTAPADMREDPAWRRLRSSLQERDAIG